MTTTSNPKNGTSNGSQQGNREGHRPRPCAGRLRSLSGARNEERGRAAAAKLEQVGDIHFVQLDVLDAASVAAAAQQIASEAGKLDTLVNNAGHWLCPRITFRSPV